MPYAPALSIGSPDATYRVISRSLNVRNRTAVVDSPARVIARRPWATTTLVVTWCVRPDSRRSISSASWAVCGLPSTTPCTMTTVSAGGTPPPSGAPDAGGALPPAKAPPRPAPARACRKDSPRLVFARPGPDREGQPDLAEELGTPGRGGGQHQWRHPVPYRSRNIH